MAHPFLRIQSKTDWDSAKKVLADNTFMDKLKNYDKVTDYLYFYPRESKCQFPQESSLRR